MGRLSRRLRLRTLLVGALFLGVLWGLSAAHAESQTVTFRGGPLAPVLCPAAPDASSLGIVEGTWINVVNQTGAPATLEVDGVANQTIVKGGGLSVMLPAGQHDLRLIPHCPTRGKLLSVLIDVDLMSSPGSPAASGSAPTAPPARSGAPGDPSVSPVGGADPRATSPVSVVSGLRSASPSPSRTSPPDAPVPVDLVVVPYAVPETDDPRGERLLAVIAAICVFGVTAAIIRAILAQRTKASNQ
jgi:hypothetical protein